LFTVRLHTHTCTAVGRSLCVSWAFLLHAVSIAAQCLNYGKGVRPSVCTQARITRSWLSGSLRLPGRVKLF